VFYLLYQYEIAKQYKGLFYTTLCLSIFAVVHKVYEYYLFVTGDHHMADIRIGFILFLLCLGLHNKIYRGRVMEDKAL
jgi:hypothetical protein